MKIAIAVLLITLAGCASRSKPTPAASNPITPSGEMPERLRVRAMFSGPGDKLLNRYNKFAEKISVWVWDYSRGMNNTKAAREAEDLFNKLTHTTGWSPRPRYELENPCEVK